MFTLIVCFCQFSIVVVVRVCRHLVVVSAPGRVEVCVGDSDTCTHTHTIKSRTLETPHTSILEMEILTGVT